MDVNTLLDFAEELLNIGRQLFCSPVPYLALAKNLGKRNNVGTTYEVVML